MDLGSIRWRMLRRLHLAGGSLPFGELRTMSRKDWANVGELHRLGLIAFKKGVDDLTAADVVRLTAAGEKAQELGEVEVTLAPEGPQPVRSPKKSRTAAK